MVDSLEITGFQKSGLSIDLSDNITVKQYFPMKTVLPGFPSGDGVSKKSNHNIYIGYCRAENNPG